MTDHPPDATSGYETTITLTLRSIGRYRSADSAREHTAELLATGQLADQEWAHSVTVTPLTADAGPDDLASRLPEADPELLGRSRNGAGK